MRLSKRGFIIIASICLAVFAACLLIVLFADTARWGTAVFTGLSGAIGNGPGILLRLFTYLGSTEGVILICVVLLAIPKRFFRRQIAFPVVSTTVISWILNEGIKLAVRRARPGVEALITASGFSFPSGHAMNNAALYFSLFFMVLRYMKPGKGRNILAAVLDCKWYIDYWSYQRGRPRQRLKSRNVLRFLIGAAGTALILYGLAFYFKIL